MADNGLIARLLAKGTVLTDGAWGTQLQARGLTGAQLADAWNLEHPELVEEVARAYVDAGSDIILTNTFRANRIALDETGLGDKVVEINRAGVEISKRAAGDRARVFASIGPSGKFLLRKQVTEPQLHDTFAEQAQALADAGADALVIETMGELTEAKLALTAAKQAGLPVVACMVYDSGKNFDRTMFGISPERAAKELTEAGADVIGANCGTGVEHYVAVCAALSAATDRPIWIKANAGLPELEGRSFVYRTTPDQFADYLPKLQDAGARFIGGCCGTTPDFIAALRKRVGTGIQ